MTKIKQQQRVHTDTHTKKKALNDPVYGDLYSLMTSADVVIDKKKNYEQHNGAWRIKSPRAFHSADGGNLCHSER